MTSSPGATCESKAVISASLTAGEITTCSHRELSVVLRRTSFPLRVNKRATESAARSLPRIKVGIRGSILPDFQCAEGNHSEQHTKYIEACDYLRFIPSFFFEMVMQRRH